MIVKYRHALGLTQEILAARLQRRGLDVSRERLSNMESGRTRVPDDVLINLHSIFKVPMIRLFPRDVQELDEKFVKFAEEHAARKSAPRKP